MTKATAQIGVSKATVGRIAERIVSNELEVRGFRVSNLNHDGPSANADLLAAGHGKVRQIQVKGATNKEDERWWVQYGYCTEAVIAKREPMFNRRSSFYQADFVVLVAVRSPSVYCCVVLPVSIAEKAAQMNMDRGYREPNRDGTKKKPGKVWRTLDSSPRELDMPLRNSEREILNKHRNVWDILVPTNVR